MINPPSPPKPKPVQFADGIRRLLQGRSFEVGFVAGLIVSLVYRLIGA